jgi:hypothetical protein
MSSQVQAQPVGSSTQVQAKTDSAVSTDSTVSKAWSKVCNFFHWRRSQPEEISVSETRDAKSPKGFKDWTITLSLKALFLSRENWTLYAGFGMAEHVEKIIEGENSVATNVFGICRQFAIASDGKFTRGISQILEQATSNKCDYGKVGEGVGYIIKGLGDSFYRPFMGAWQYGVSAWTAAKDKFFSSTDTHYTYKKAYNDLKESFKIIGAAIDMSPIGMAGGALYYKIKGQLMLLEGILCKWFNLDNKQNENNICSNETLRKWRYASVAIAPCISTLLWANVPVGDLIVKIISGALGGIITYYLGPTLGQLFESQQDQQPVSIVSAARIICTEEVAESQPVQQLILQHHRIWIEPEIFAGAL